MVNAADAVILLVDDFDDAREIYRDYLTFLGYTVIVAASGSEALESLRNVRPGIVLMDVRMPGMSGTEAMLRMKADPAFSGVPIVAFTAHALDVERTAALAAGFDAVLAKPCLPDELAQFIADILRRP